jgi:hypothetical protein
VTVKTEREHDVWEKKWDNYVIESVITGKKVFRLTSNFTRRLTYDTRVVYGVCHGTHRIIAL